MRRHYDYKILHADSESKLITQIKHWQEKGWERDESYSLKPQSYYRAKDWSAIPLDWYKVWWIQMKKEMEVKK